MLDLAVLDTSNNVVHTARSAWSLAGLLPGDPDRAWSHAIPAATLPAGDFRLLLRVVNPLEGGKALRFANTTQDADLAGWLILGEFTVPINR